MASPIRCFTYAALLVTAAPALWAQAPTSTASAPPIPGVPVVKPPAVSSEPAQLDSTKPQTAVDAARTTPETARDDQRLTLASARDPQKDAPETARDDKRLTIATARDSTRSGPETAQDDPKLSVEDATDDLRKADARKAAALRQAKVSAAATPTASATQQR
jgi:hypothetical protein